MVSAIATPKESNKIIVIIKFHFHYAQKKKRKAFIGGASLCRFCLEWLCAGEISREAELRSK